MGTVWANCPCLPCSISPTIHLLEEVTLITVALLLRVCIVVTAWGPAATFRRLLWGLSPAPLPLALGVTLLTQPRPADAGIVAGAPAALRLSLLSGSHAM